MTSGLKSEALPAASGDPTRSKEGSEQSGGLGQARALRGSPGRPRVMLLMPPRVAGSWQPHLGLGILASRLSRAGFSPLAVDYSYVEDLPEVGRFIGEFEPDIFGVSLFSQNLRESESFIARLHSYRPKTPIILGGPHVSLANEDESRRIARMPGVTTIVKGEADADIVEIVTTALADRSPRVVACNPLELSRFSPPDFRYFINGPELRTYPIQLSRGCPYRCIFCNVARISSRKYRTRPVDDCIEEIGEAVGRYPNLEFIKVTDDAPNCQEPRFEEFLRTYVARGFRPRLEIMQMRADHLTLEMCRLIKKAGAPCICLGVETGDPRVFASVRKGETLEQIERACGYVRSSGIPLVLCFVLGLPEATRESDLASIAFARRMRPIHCYWNLAQPMPGTEMYDYFTEHGTIFSGNPMEESSLDRGCPAETPSYSRKERMDVQMIAQATTNERAGTPWSLLRQIAAGGFRWDYTRALLARRPKIPPDIPRRW